MKLLTNGRLITQDPANPFIENGAVAYDEGVILEVGPTAELAAKYPGAAQTSARGGVIMPGLINAHNHIYSAFARGMAIKGYNPRGFLDILDGLWWTLDRNLLLDGTRLSAEATFIDCIENGVTAIFDHHASYGQIQGSLFAIADAARKYGVRATLCYEISERDGQDKMRAAVKENMDFVNYAESEGSDTIHGMIGMHAPFTLSDAALDYCVRQNTAHAGYHIHVAEGIEDVYDSLAKHGKHPAFRLYDMGILGKKTICGHCTHITAAEIDLLKATGTIVAHNPESNMGNAIGCPPAINMFHKGILVGLGTDGYTSDMFESYKVGSLLHRHELHDPNAAWSELPAMLFQNNPLIAARFFKKPLGRLIPGAYADMIVLDYTPLTPMTAANLNSHLLFGMNGRNVVTTIINGQTKMLNRELIGVDKEAVLAHCRESAQDMWDRINAGK